MLFQRPSTKQVLFKLFCSLQSSSLMVSVICDDMCIVFGLLTGIGTKDPRGPQQGGRDDTRKQDLWFHQLGADDE